MLPRAYKTKDRKQLTQSMVDTVQRLASQGLSRSSIAETLFMSPGTLVKRMQEDPRIEEAYQKGFEQLLDRLEEEAYKKCFTSDKVLIYTLSTKGRKRGWGRSTELSNPDGTLTPPTTQTVKIEMNNANTKTLEDIRQQLEKGIIKASK